MELSVSSAIGSKKKKLKIRKEGTASGVKGKKVVFDASGTPRLPLEALAADAGGEAEGAGGEDGGGGGEDPAFRDVVAARFAAVAAARAEADRADKPRERELRRAKKLARTRGPA